MNSQFYSSWFFLQYSYNYNVVIFTSLDSYIILFAKYL